MKLSQKNTPTASTGNKTNGLSPGHTKILLLLGLTAFIVYANTLANGFAFDDLTVITGNKIVQKGIRAIPEILCTPYHYGNYTTANDLYRPLSLVMFAIEYQLFGANPMPGHLVNVLLFAFCVILLFNFLDGLFDRKQTNAVLIASLLFALHPIHTEVVANIKSRDELLCFFFAFLSIGSFMHYMNFGKPKHIAFGTLYFFASLLSKESVVTFVAVLPLVFFFYQNKSNRRAVHICLSAAIVIVVYLVTRFSVLGAFHENSVTTIPFLDNALSSASISSSSRIATAMLAMGYYLKLLFIPYPLISDYSYNGIPFVDFADGCVWLTIAAYVVLAAAAVVLFRRNRKNGFSFGILFFLITISLYSNIPFLIGTQMGERLLFFPSVGFCLCCGLAVAEGTKAKERGLAIFRNRSVLMTVMPIAAIYVFLTIDRNGEWKSNYTLFKADVEKAPNVCKLNYNLAVQLTRTMSEKEDDPASKKRMKDEGMTYLYRARAICPDWEKIQAELSNEYFQRGQFDSAEFYGNRAIAFDSLNAVTMNNLGGIHFRRNEYQQAITWCTKAIKIQPDFAEPYINVAACYLRLHNIDSGRYYLRQVLSFSADNARPYEYMAMSFLMTQQPDSARKYAMLARKYDPAFRL